MYKTSPVRRHAAEPSRAGAPAQVAPVVLRYSGPTPLTVRGPVSGVLYTFALSGAQVQIDPRDLPGLGRRPLLTEV